MRIHEKVTITPRQVGKGQSTLTPNSNESPCLLCAGDSADGFVVWYGSGGWPLTKHAGCDYDPWLDTTMNVDFIEGTDYVRVDRQDGESISDPGYHFQMRTWDNIDFHMFFDKREPEDSARVSYIIGSDAPGACPVTNIFIVVRPRYFLSASSVEEIHYGEQADIYVEARNPCQWIPPPLPDSTTFSASIVSGMQYGILVNTLTNDSGSSLQGLHNEQGFLSTLAFIADGIMPDSLAEVRIKINTSDTRVQAAELSININPGCLVVSFSPAQIALGDTANIILENKLPNGTRVPFPTDRTFEIWINNGEQYGILQSNSSMSENPLRF